MHQHLTPWQRVLRAAALGLSAAALALAAGCAHRPPAALSPLPPALLADHLFTPLPPRPGAAELFALDASMRAWAEQSLVAQARRRDARRVLVDALLGEQALRYDTSRTRSAAEAWHDKAGNCLSLVMMTAAFAHHLGLPVFFQQVLMDEQYTQATGSLTLASGHVNLLLTRPAARHGTVRAEQDDLTVDFLPPAERLGQRSVPLAQATVVAMFMNNRAAEALAEGRLDEAYAWARATLQHDPAFFSGHNTLAVIYQRAGHAGPAEAVLRHVLAHDPRQTAALSNLVRLLQHQGRADEARPLAARLAALQPLPPLHHLRLGLAALDAGQASEARRHLERELRLQPTQHQAHHALARALWALGEHSRALRHLRLAADYSGSPDERQHYSSQLQALRAAPPGTGPGDGARLLAMP